MVPRLEDLYHRLNVEYLPCCFVDNHIFERLYEAFRTQLEQFIGKLIENGYKVFLTSHMSIV